MMQLKEKIVIKAMCLFYNDGKVLVAKGFDEVKKKSFYRVIGGTVDFFETAEAGVRREIQEELHSDIENLKLIDVVENLFTFEGNRGHEVVFLYSGNLSRKELYKQRTVRIVEPTYEIEAEWILLDDITTGKIPLFPEFDYKSLFIKVKS